MRFCEKCKTAFCLTVPILSQVKGMRIGRDSHACGLVRNPDRIVAVGGDTNTEDYHDKTTSEIFFLESGSWAEGPGIPGRNYHSDSVAVQYGDTFLLIGGNNVYDDERGVGNIYQFDARNFAWVKRKESLQLGRSNYAGFELPMSVKC